MSQQQQQRIRVAIIGYGHLGQYLVDAIQNDASVAPLFELVLVWNRSADKLSALQPAELRYSGELDRLFEHKSSSEIDLIVEVCHPSIVARHGAQFLRAGCSLFVGSPTAFADADVERAIREAIAKPSPLSPSPRRRLERAVACYVPSGALWGADDIAKMGQAGSIRALAVTMKKHPTAFKLEEPLHSKLNDWVQQS